MEENILEYEEVDFNEELAKINLEENKFPEISEYEKGEDENANNES